MDGRWLTSEQAAALLGVKPATLYAYVSRGIIERAVVVEQGRRQSRFDRSAVLGLAEGRARPRSGVWQAFIESEVTTLDAAGGLAFRGVSLDDCVAMGFEGALSHVLGGPAAPLPLALPAGGGGRGADVLRHTVLELAAADPDRSNIGDSHARAAAVTAIRLSVLALTGRSTPTVAEALAAAWTPAGGPAPVDLLDAALTVLIDHELTASTLAARAAAGVRADPWMVLLTGLAAMSGAQQAGASAGALAGLRAWEAGRGLPAGTVAGFGHKVYVGPDPRAELLLSRLAPLWPSTHQLVEAMSRAVAVRQGHYPNVDLALAALTHALGLPEDAGELLFTLARMGGLMAHAMEEYPLGLRLRPRASG